MLVAWKTGDELEVRASCNNFLSNQRIRRNKKMANPSPNAKLPAMVWDLASVQL